MAKKCKITLGTIITCSAIALGLAAFFMMFATAVSGTGKLIGTTPSYKGTEVIFGYKEGDTVLLNFNFIAFLGLFILPLASVCLACASLLTGKKVLSYVSAALFIVGAILAFLTVAIFKSGVASGTLYDAYEWKLAAGPILSAIFGIVAGAGLATKELLKL